MKKMIVTLVLGLSGFFARATEKNVNPVVLNAFDNEFRTAKEVEWTVGSNYYMATFVYNEQHVFAYYNTNGELLGVTRYISPSELPLALQSNLKKNYSDYWISGLFELANSEGTTYFVTVENAEHKYVLKTSDGRDWVSYQKTRKS